MSISSLMIILGLILVFVGLFSFILKEGGWQQGGCSGDCSSCHSDCEKNERDKESAENK